MFKSIGEDDRDCARRGCPGPGTRSLSTITSALGVSTMSNGRHSVLAFTPVLPLAMALSSLVSPLAAMGQEGAKLQTCETSAGEKYFALSLTPQIDARADLGQDVMAFFDTSASQVGVYREDSLIALRTFLAQLKKS